MEERYKVMIIEDEASARKMLAKAVTKEGFDVVTAGNGREGLEMFEKESPEIVISDLKMPEVGGLEVMRKLKESVRNVQFILVTAFGETDTAIMALNEGALDYIKKPIDLDLLAVTLGRAKEKVSEYRKIIHYPCILLAEDDKATRERLSKVLGKEPFKVIVASDGQEAMELFDRNKVDVALLDIKMPKKDGLSALHDMRKETEDFEAIILTGYGDETSAIQALRDGAANFIKKPIDIEQLSVIVNKAIEGLTLKRALRYRTREVELAREVILRLTASQELVIDMRKPDEKSWGFAASLLGAVPIAIAAINEKMEFEYINQNLINVLEEKPKVIDKKFVEGLSRIGIADMTYDSLTSAVKNILSKKAGEVESVETGKYSFILMTPITVVREKKKDNLVLMVLRGERKGK